jgi:hypothetical protein
VSRALRTGAAALLTLLACALPAGGAQAAHRENIARATIEQDAGRAFDFAWDVSHQRGGVVDHVNRAHAAARCTDCEATAIAFQIVLVSGAPSTAAPINEAVALNLECTRCETVAEARQFVRVVDAPAKLTRSGRATLRDVRRDLRALEAQDPPIDQLHQAVESAEARVRQVLNSELVLRSRPSQDADVIDAQLAQDAEQG